MTSPHLLRQSTRPAAALAALVSLSLLVAPSFADPKGPSDAPTSATGGGLLGRPEQVTLRPVEGSVVSDRTVPVRVGFSALRVQQFKMLGFTWEGRTPDLQWRVYGDDGKWQPWRQVEHWDDAPLRVRASDVAWVGARSHLQLRLVHGQEVRAVLIDPGVAPGDATAAPDPLPEIAPRPGKAPQPRLRTRQAWGADERWRDPSSLTYNDTIKQVHVHHTVNSNSYWRTDVPALIRGMYRYHTQSLGWSDIGYNFLVDRFGDIWVGRAGGPLKPVRGAHTLGFNDTSTGVSVIGNFETMGPNRRIVRALVHLSAWKLDMYDRSPSKWIRVRSTGSDKYPAGRWVSLPVIDGHRDTNDTACPGYWLYRKLPTIRQYAQGRVDYY